MASIQDALVGAAGMAGAAAFRPDGTVVVINRRGSLFKHLGTHLNPWIPNFQDLIATDWAYGLMENIARQFAAAAAAAQEPSQGGKRGASV